MAPLSRPAEPPAVVAPLAVPGRPRVGRGDRRRRRRLRGGRARARPARLADADAAEGGVRSRPRADRHRRSSRRSSTSRSPRSSSVHLLQNVILADWAPPLLVLGPVAGDDGGRGAAAMGAGRHGAAGRPHLLAGRAGTSCTCRPSTATPSSTAGRSGSSTSPSSARAWSSGGPSCRPAACARRPGCSSSSPRSSPRRRSPSRSPSRSRSYDFYKHAPKLWGLSPLEDQQIGAIGMAIEQAAILFAACSIVFMRLLDEDEPRRGR